MSSMHWEMTDSGMLAATTVLSHDITSKVENNDNIIKNIGSERPPWLTDEWIYMYGGFDGDRKMSIDEFEAFLQGEMDTLVDYGHEIVPKLLHHTGVWVYEYITLIKKYIKEINSV